MRGSRIAAPVGGVVAAGTSVVCMASMGAMVAATTAGATAGMAGMGAAAASTPHVPAITRALRAVGLGALTHVPNAVLQPLLIILLLIAIGAALWRARNAWTAQALALALLIVAAAVGLIAWAGTTPTFLVNAVSFAFSAAMLTRLSMPRRESSPRTGASARGWVTRARA